MVAIRMTKLYHWCVIAGAIVICFAAIFRGLSANDILALLIGIVGLVAIALLGKRALQSVPTLMEMSREGLYVRQYKRRFDWRDIERAYVIDMAERMSTGEKVATAVAGNRAASLAMLIGLKFTQSGLQKHGVLADSFWRRKYKDYDDHVVIRTQFFELGKGTLSTIPGMVEEIERFRQQYSNG